MLRSTRNTTQTTNTTDLFYLVFAFRKNIPNFLEVSGIFYIFTPEIDYPSTTLILNIMKIPFNTPNAHSGNASQLSNGMRHLMTLMTLMTLLLSMISGTKAWAQDYVRFSMSNLIFYQ